MPDGIHGTLTGRVKKVFPYAHGLALAVEVLREGRKYPDTVTVWGVEDRFVAGDHVRIEGDVWAKEKTKDGRTFVDVFMNNPTVVEQKKAEHTPPATQPDVSWPTAPIDDGWPVDGPVF